MKNEIVREAAKRAGVHLWEIAYRMGMNDGNFSRKLRNELPTEEQDTILSIIEELSMEREER